MIEILILVVAMLVGVFLGWHLREIHAIRTIGNLIKESEQQVDKVSMRIKIEKEKDFLYVYNADTSAFLLQAETFDKVDALLAEKFPGKKFLISAENVKEVGLEL